MLALLALALTVQSDSLVLAPDDYLDRVLRHAPGIEAASLRASSAWSLAAQAGAWDNPSLSVNVDNVGAEEEVTGIPGARGVEGQAVLSLRLPLGGDRGARMDQSTAAAEAADAASRWARLTAVEEAASALARSTRDRRLEDLAREELEALETLATALQAQAAAGRASEADAARARLAVAVARESLALRQAAAARSSAEAALFAGLSPPTTIQVTPVRCGAANAVDASASVASPLVDAADARVREAHGEERLAGALRIPDLEPEIGIRRTMGVEALYAGFGLQLPWFDRGGRRLEAARARRTAAEADASDARRRLESEMAARRAALEALTLAGEPFRTSVWDRDQATVVEAARARLELGEGSLMELLDVRRARLQALEARERWAAEWRAAQAAVFTIQGREPVAALFCDPLLGEDR